jgi:hypothetical protein
VFPLDGAEIERCELTSIDSPGAMVPPGPTSSPAELQLVRGATVEVRYLEQTSCEDSGWSLDFWDDGTDDGSIDDDTDDGSDDGDDDGGCCDGGGDDGGGDDGGGDDGGGDDGGGDDGGGDDGGGDDSPLQQPAGPAVNASPLPHAVIRTRT